MTGMGITVAVVLALGLLGLVLWKGGGAYLKFQGKRVVACPETSQPAAVELAAGRAALTAVFGEPALRLRDCSRWSERGPCGQDCLRQIEEAPEDCLLRTILTNWYREKECACCGKPIAEINWMQHKPCLMSPDLRIRAWKDFRPEHIPQVLETHRPVCWNCLIADTHTW
ncbi:MAG: hypothetical protein ABSG79_25870 [Bryobacteraceae bacterium]